MSRYEQEGEGFIYENPLYLEGEETVDGSHGQLPQSPAFQCKDYSIQDDFYLFLNLFKNNNQLITLFMQQISTAIHFLSNTRRAHGHLNLSFIFFPLFKGMLKAEGQIKIGGLSNCISLRNKE